MSTRLVDIDITLRVLATEVEVDADYDLETFRADLRTATVAHVARGFHDEAATVTAVAVVTPV